MPDNQPLVSVIMNCLNCEKYLKEAIDSVYTQTYDNWEIIFWDNASSDSSSEIARSYDKKLRYYKSEKTIPLGAARNNALEQAKGEFIAFLDSDDLWMPEKLKKQVPLFQRNHRVGIVYSDALWYNESGKVEKSLGKKNLLKGQCFGKMLTNYLLTMSATIIRKRALDDLVEWFDVQFDILEDADLFRRIAYSWELDYVNLPLAKWRIHNGSLTWSNEELFVKEGEIMINKFSKLYSDFDIRFAKEKKSYLAGLARKRALFSWRKENRALARKQLFPYLFNDKRNFMLFVMTIFPYWLYRRVYGLFRMLPE
jgi:glycosyltransferase involved in cell wall biosynthesis